MFKAIASGLLALLPLATIAQQPTSLQGKWTDAMTGTGGGELEVELVVAQTTGTWRFIPRGGQARNNPCLGKEFPVAVASQTDTELQIKVDGSSIIQGCINQAAVLKLTASNSLEGALEDGRVVKLIRP